jgi:hypothetical protein
MTITEQKINFIEGFFSSSEAADIINKVLDVKINFHKLQRLSRTEKDVHDGCEFDSGRMEELIKEKATAQEFFSHTRFNGKRLKVKSVIQIEIED